jgi:hypothetical protein
MGKTPADLPIDLPAKGSALSRPPSLLGDADKVIEQGGCLLQRMSPLMTLDRGRDAHC